MKTVFKIVLLEDGEYKTLFHGIDGSRKLPIDTIIEAEKKMRVDGGGQEPYLTGIHCFKDRKTAEDYLTNFRKPANRQVIKCWASGLRQKKTNKDVYLADTIYIERNTHA